MYNGRTEAHMETTFNGVTIDRYHDDSGDKRVWRVVVGDADTTKADARDIARTSGTLHADEALGDYEGRDEDCGGHVWRLVSVMVHA